MKWKFIITESHRDTVAPDPFEGTPAEALVFAESFPAGARVMATSFGAVEEFTAQTGWDVLHVAPAANGSHCSVNGAKYFTLEQAIRHHTSGRSPAPRCLRISDLSGRLTQIIVVRPDDWRQPER